MRLRLIDALKILRVGLEEEKLCAGDFLAELEALQAISPATAPYPSEVEALLLRSW